MDKLSWREHSKPHYCMKFKEKWKKNLNFTNAPSEQKTKF